MELGQRNRIWVVKVSNTKVIEHSHYLYLFSVLSDLGLTSFLMMATMLCPNDHVYFPFPGFSEASLPIWNPFGTNIHVYVFIKLYFMSTVYVPFDLTYLQFMLSCVWRGSLYPLHILSVE